MYWASLNTSLTRLAKHDRHLSNTSWCSSGRFPRQNIFTFSFENLKFHKNKLRATIFLILVFQVFSCKFLAVIQPSSAVFVDNTSWCSQSWSPNFHFFYWKLWIPKEEITSNNFSFNFCVPVVFVLFLATLCQLTLFFYKLNIFYGF